MPLEATTTDSAAPRWRRTAASRSTRPGKSARRAEPARARNAAGTSALRAALRPATLRTSALRTTTPRPAGLLLHIQEGPLVVVVSPLVKANRFLLALAADAHDAARNGAAESRSLLRLRLRLRAASTLRLRTTLLSGHAARADQFEVFAG